MIIKTFTFPKDKKSTKIPTEGGVEYNIVLKENTNVDNPTFILTHNGVPTFDYCLWIFGYYFVEDIKLQSKDVYEVNCKLDVLATYRNDILNSNQFVLRSSSDYNTYLKDDIMIPSYNQVVNNYITDTSLIDIGGTYIIRVIGKTDNQTPTSYGIATYIVTSSQIREIIAAAFNNAIFGNTTWNIDELGNLFKCVFFDPASYILSINWLPTTITSEITKEIFLGWYGTGVIAPCLQQASRTTEFTINTPSKYFNDFRDYDTDFTQFTLSLPCVGIVELNPNDVYSGLSCRMSVEFLTGNLFYMIRRSDNNSLIYKFNTNINTEIQIAGLVNHINGSSLTSLGKSIAKNLIPSAPEYSVLGNVGSRVEIDHNYSLRVKRRIFTTHEFAVSKKGRPLRENRTLSNLSGYCQCENAKLDTTAYGLIKDEIIDYMNEGFFIE